MKNVPKLRFKEFKGEWHKTRLEEKYSFIRNGFVGIATPYYVDNGVKYLQGKNIKNGQIDGNGLIYISDFFNEKYKKSQLKINDVVMVQSGHVGECAVIDGDYAGSNCHALVILTPHDGNAVSSVFLVNYFYSSYGKKLIDKVKTGNTIEHILASEVKVLSPMLPDDVKEQTKIADFLTAIDDRITQLTQKVDGLQQYKKAVMQQIFSQKLRFKDEKGRAFGAWDKDNLLNLSEEGFTNGVFNDPKKTGRGYKLINVLDMYIDSTIDEKRLSLVELSDAEFKKNKVEHGEIFFTRSSLVKSGIAHSNIYLGDSQDVTFDGHLIRMRPRKNLINPIFLNYLLKTPEVRKQLVARGKTATMTTIGQADIAAVTVEFPSLPEQAKIAGFLGAVDEKLAQAKAKLDAVKQYKQGLLQQMFV
jgi:type I restriction enzyme S subunit